MKVLIIAINSKYIHTSLAPWYLKSNCCNRDDIKVMDFTINQNVYDIRRRIYSEKPDIIGFSCYIFNRIIVENLAADLKKLLPHIKIILGGPEVSYDAEDIMQRCKAVDYIICGEGEKPFSELIESLQNDDHHLIDGVACRQGNRIHFQEQQYSTDLDHIHSPYSPEMLQSSSGKILYFETSRGCPFQCSYCLSSRSGGVRFFSLERVKKDLDIVMASPAKQIKFVDRTFNCRPDRAKEIIRYILSAAENDKTGVIKNKNFHFEAAADLFDHELIDILSRAPEGLFQLEIGIQSLNENTLAAVNRKTSIEKCCRTIKKLIDNNNVHIHLDLIAGLPYENLPSFAQSFDGLYQLQPHCIQLGFLKLLKGSKMREDAFALHYTAETLPPYEVLSTPSLSFDELSILKNIAKCVDKLYNTGKYKLSLHYIISEYGSAFKLFFQFTDYLYKKGCFERALSQKELAGLFIEFAKANLEKNRFVIFNELIKFDYYASDNSCNPPTGIKREYDPSLRQLYAQHANQNRIHYEKFNIDPISFCKSGIVLNQPVLLCFDYGRRHPVTGLFDVHIVRDN